MKKTTTFAKVSKIISVILITATMATVFCGCSAIPQKSCNHNYYLSDYSDATVSDNGLKKFTCSNCGNSYQEVIPSKEVSTRENTANDTSDIPEETTPDLTRKRSVNLFDLPVYSSKADMIYYSAEDTDADGWKHTDCYCFAGQDYENWLRYEVNSNYTTISGSLYAAYSNHGSGWLEFYDGENFLAATPKISSENTSTEFEIDITNVEYLTVRCCSNTRLYWMIADDIILTK